MKRFASRTGITVAVSAAAMSVVWGLFVPHGYPWPSLAWAVLACAAAALTDIAQEKNSTIIFPIPRTG